MKLLAVILGIVTSIALYANWLIVESEWWSTVFFNSVDVKNLNEHFGYALYLAWLHLVPISLFSFVIAIIVYCMGHSRFFIYSALATTVFTFFILPKLPIFNILLANQISYFRFVDIFVITFLFLSFFYLATIAVKKYDKSI